MHINNLITLLTIFLFNCQKEPTAAFFGFDKEPVSVSVIPGVIDEVSGIADSYTHPGFLWVHQDSGNEPALHLLDHSGKHGRKIPIAANNRDWEDMAISSGPQKGQRYVYIGEIGDNAAEHPTVGFYRFIEPASGATRVTDVDAITYRYEDGPRDAEAFLVDATTKDIYVITKREPMSRIYRISYPYKSDVNVASFEGELKFNNVVSAAFAPDDKSILIKTYLAIYYFERKAGQTVLQALQSEPMRVGYKLEPQGEAIAFSRQNKGFYTLSEKAFAPSVNLHFYKRN